jgi:hypothetical protein
MIFSRFFPSVLFVIVLVLSLLSTARAAAAWTDAPDPASNPGFDAFYNNEFDRAIAYFSQQMKAHPNDPDQYNYLAQTILYREMLRDGALESQLVTGNNPFLRRPKMEIDAADKQQFDYCLNESIKLSRAGKGSAEAGGSLRDWRSA